MNTKLPRRALSIIVTMIFVLTTFIGTMLPVSAAGDDVAVTNLRVEYMTNPIGIDSGNPRFSWIMESNTRGQKQTAYQILVSSSPDGNGDVWDSGKVESDESVGIEYEGPALQSKTRYFWKVSIWDKDGTKLNSNITWFETGLLDKSEWVAKFIAVGDQADKDNIKSYTIELDFMVEQDAAGIIFGGKGSGNFLMWQINTLNFAEDKKVCFRPHIWKDGRAAKLEDKDISHAIPWEERFDVHHLKIQVAPSNEIITYIDDVEIDRRTNDMASFGQFGFRQNKSSNENEGAYYDNIIITDNTDDKNEIVFNESFDSVVNPFATGEIINGQLFVKGTGVYMKSVFDTETSAPMFRKEFTVDPGKTIKQARLYSSALGVYEAYVNGQKVGVDKLAPGWTDYFAYVFYQTYDVTDLIGQGENAIGAVVGDGWYSGHVSLGAGNVHKYGVDVAFIGQLEIVYTDGTIDIIATDDTWKGTKNGPFILTDNQDGETYDARKEMSGWDKPGFDDNEWTGTKIATKSNIDTKCDVENINLRAQIGPPVAVTQELTVKNMTEPEPGVYIFDLGQNIVGWARIKVNGPAGTSIRLRFGETLYDEKYEHEGHKEGTLYTENLRSAKATDYYILKGDPEGEVYEPRFTFHGFRYIEVTGYPGVPTADDVTGIVVGSDMEPVGNYETSDPLVNQLFSNIVWGQRGNFLSIPTDCPQRDERCGWTGDAQIFALTAMMNMDVNQFFRKYMLDVKTAQRENGAIYDIAPAQGHGVGAGNAAWADAAVIIPWNMYITYGDTQIIEECYEMMKKHVAYYRDIRPKGVEGTHIIKDCAYGDWVSMGENTPKDVISTAYYAYSTDLLSKMARAIGENADADYYEQLFSDIRDDFNKYFVSADGMIKGNSQTAYLVALKMNLLPTEELREKAAQHLVERIKANNWHLTTGFVGVSYLCPVLSEMGYSDIAYKLLLNQTFPSWLYSVVNGATTIWERWNSYTIENGFGPVGMNSFNHYSFGSIGEWMYNHSAGIDLDESNPGYKHILIKPEPNKAFSYVNGSYESVYGRIESNWTLDKDTGNFVLNVKIPANTYATVYLPSDVAEGLKVDGIPYTPSTTNIEGVEYLENENGNEIFSVESGSYKFESRILNTYALSIDSKDEFIIGQVKVDGKTEKMKYTGFFKEGAKVTVEASPANDIDYEFAGWDDSNTDSTRTIVVDEDINLKASFAYKGSNNLAMGKGVKAKSSDGGAPAWSTKNLTDGLYISTGLKGQGIKGYTSKGHDTQDITSEPEWVEIDLGADTQFNKIHLYPRTDVFAANGETAGFPKDFTIEVKGDGETAYTTVATLQDYAAPYLKPAVFEISDQTARYIKITATKLGDMAVDDVYYRLQLIEVGVYNSQPPESVYTLTINNNGVGNVLLNGEEITLPYTGTFDAGEKVKLEAKNKDFCEFVKWSGSHNSFEKELYIVINTDLTITGEFIAPSNKNMALGKVASASDSITAPGTWEIRLLTDGTKKGTGYSSNFVADPDIGVIGAKWVSIDLQKDSIIDTVILYPRTDGAVDSNGQTPSYPVDFEIQVRADGETQYRTVKQISNEPNPQGMEQTYSFDAPVIAKEVRIFVTKLGTREVSDQGGHRLQLAEMEIYNRNYPAAIEITSDNVICEGEQEQLEIQAKLADGSRMNVDNISKVITISDTSVAMVTDSGIINALTAGTTTITAALEINGFGYICSQELVVIEKDIISPRNVTNVAVAAGDGQLTITWTDPEDQYLDKIKIVEEDEQSVVEAVYVEPGVESVTITGLTNGKNYTFRIITIDTSGNESNGVLVNATPSESGAFTVETTFTVGDTVDATKLEANELLDASAVITNNGAAAKQVLMIVALYDGDNRMVNVSYLSREVAAGATENFHAGFKLPSDVKDYKAKAFVWEGESITSTTMTPLSNVVEITD